jgi:hypothetical protein
MPSNLSNEWDKVAFISARMTADEVVDALCMDTAELLELLSEDAIDDLIEYLADE